MEWMSPETIATVGFPIAMAGYLVVRMELVIRDLTKAVQHNTILLNLMVKEGGK